MERIEALYHDTGGKCYVSFSGGKDSTVILALIKMCEQIYTLPIEDFIDENNIPLSKAYTEQGYERTGCFLCPYSLHLGDNLIKLHKYEPLRYKAAMHWLKDVYIAQNVSLPFDPKYETERIKKWSDIYSQMRFEMLLKYRPLSAKKIRK